MLNPLQEAVRFSLIILLSGNLDVVDIEGHVCKFQAI